MLQCPFPAVFHGDILLTPEQREALESNSMSNHSSPQMAVVRSAFSLWPDGIVPYVYDRNLNGTKTFHVASRRGMQ
jgi:hypothetical protein